MDKEERAHATVHAPSRILRSIPEATGRVSPGAFPGPSPGPFPGPSPGALTLCFGSSGLFPCLCGHLLKARMCFPPPLLNVFSLLGRPERLSPSPRLLLSVLEAPGREDSEAHVTPRGGGRTQLRLQVPLTAVVSRRNVRNVHSWICVCAQQVSGWRRRNRKSVSDPRRPNEAQVPGNPLKRVKSHKPL